MTRTGSDYKSVLSEAALPDNSASPEGSPINPHPGINDATLLVYYCQFAMPLHLHL
jgi:hypothetical protein